MGLRGHHWWSKQRLPVGTVRIRRRGGRRVRMIKARQDGPQGPRWVNFARHWWLANRGPIAAGMRVVHLDGDTLNDDPANYGLATADDILMLSRDWDPELDANNRRAQVRATIATNRQRGRVNRARNWLPTRWYPVDLAARVVVNLPCRSRVLLFRHYAGAVQSANGAGLAGAWLGWPGLPALDAMMLTSLAGGATLDAQGLRRAVEELNALYLWRQSGPARLSTYYCAVSRLRARGWLASWRRHHAITAAALAARRPPFLYVAVRGERIPRDFPDFRKVWPEQR